MCVFTVHVVLPGLEALKILRTDCPLTAACSVVTAFTSTSVGCLSFQLSGGACSEFTSTDQCKLTLLQNYIIEYIFLKDCGIRHYSIRLRLVAFDSKITSEIFALNV